MKKTGLKISGLIALLSFGLFYLFANKDVDTALKDDDTAFALFLIGTVSVYFSIFCLGIIMYEKRNEAGWAREDMKILSRAREEGIAQARAEAAKRRNTAHAPNGGFALICPVCLGSGWNAGGYICPRCKGVGRA